MTGQAAALVDRGRRALDACDWAAASDAFEQARASEESAEVLDGLGEARYWQGAYAESAALRERAYALYRRRGHMVEAPNAWLKDRRGLRRFARRGLAAAQAELSLASAVTNLIKIATNGITPARLRAG